MKAYFITTILLFFLNVPVHADEKINKQQAISIAQQTNPGRVLAVKRNENTFNVKILNTNGEVRIIKINANSGKITSGQ